MDTAKIIMVTAEIKIIAEIEKYPFKFKINELKKMRRTRRDKYKSASIIGVIVVNKPVIMYETSITIINNISAVKMFF